MAITAKETAHKFSVQSAVLCLACARTWFCLLLITTTRSASNADEQYGYFFIPSISKWHRHRDDNTNSTNRNAPHRPDLQPVVALAGGRLPRLWRTALLHHPPGRFPQVFHPQSVTRNTHIVTHQTRGTHDAEPSATTPTSSGRGPRSAATSAWSKPSRPAPTSTPISWTICSAPAGCATSRTPAPTSS